MGRVNVKTARTWTTLGVLIAGLLCGHASIRAQPASELDPAPDQPAQAGGDRIPADDEAIVIDDLDKPWSQGVSMENRSAARAIFLEGNRLFWVPLFARAAERYTAALALWKHPAFYFNLALAQLNLGQDVEARESLELALAHGEEPLGAKLFQEGQKRLEEVTRQLGRIRVICRTPGAEVTLDCVTLFTGPGRYEGWAKAQPHELTAKKPGYQSEARRVTVPAGELLNLDLSLLTLSQATDASRRWVAWKPWVVIAAGGAVAAAGGGLHAHAFRTFKAYDRKFPELEDCAQGPSPPGCLEDDPRLPDLKLARRKQAIAMGSYVVGGSLIAAGVVLLYLNRPRQVEQRSSSAFAGSVTLLPDLADGQIGISVRVRR
jgi:hypothetical protein